MKIEWLKNNETQKTLKVTSSKMKDFFIEFNAFGFYKKDFLFPNGDRLFEATQIEIVDSCSNKTIIKDREKSYDISVFDIWDYVSEMDDSGTFNYLTVKRLLDTLSFDWIDLNVLSKKSLECECCGDYEIINFKLINKKTNTNLEFVCDTHFYSGQLPNMKDLLSFIIDGK